MMHLSQLWDAVCSDDDVLGLDIAVQDPGRMGVSQSFEQDDGQRHGAGRRQWTALEQDAQRRSLNQFHCDVIDAVVGS